MLNFDFLAKSLEIVSPPEFKKKISTIFFKTNQNKTKKNMFLMLSMDRDNKLTNWNDKLDLEV